MLKTRVVTALVLVSLLLPALFLMPQSLWALVVAAFVGVGAWEWGGFLRWSQGARILYGVVFAVVCAAISLLQPLVMGVGGAGGLDAPWVIALYGVSLLFWGAVVPFWLRHKWQLQGAGVGSLVGIAVLLPTWLAMVQLRVLGAEVLLAIFAVVWMADIAAYFAGKAFGRRKLAPSISPGKTWEGAAGALLGVLVYGGVMRTLAGLEYPSLLVWCLALVVVTAISIVGDLYESLLKRKAGIKDSSNVLPGHGGVLDRIDSLTSTLPVVALFWLLYRHFG